MKNKINKINKINENKLIIDGSNMREIRIALLSNDHNLKNFNLEDSYNRSIKNNIYIAKIEKIDYTINAIFLNYGCDKEGFLPFNELNSKLNFKKDDKLQNLKKGQYLLVQVSKDERGNKGATFTTFIALNGKYCTIAHKSNKKIIVSKSIDKEEEKNRLRDICNNLIDDNDDFTFIIKSAIAYKSKSEIKKEFYYLKNLWNHVINQKSHVPTLIYEEGNLIQKSIRDYHDTVKEIMVAGDTSYDIAHKFIKTFFPNTIDKLVKYTENQNIFTAVGIADQVHELYFDNIPLKSGNGYIVINQTEALTAIDVNSGRQSNEPFKINMEATEEAVKQIELRSISGLIVIDFIDMSSEDEKHQIYEKLNTLLSVHKNCTKVSKMSEFCLVEISRQRLENNIYELYFDKCEACNGSGRTRKIQMTSHAILRALQDTMEKNYIFEISGSHTVILELCNYHKETLINLEKEYQTKIVLSIDEKAGPDNFFLEKKKEDLSVKTEEKIIPIKIQQIHEPVQKINIAEKQFKQEGWFKSLIKKIFG